MSDSATAIERGGDVTTNDGNGGGGGPYQSATDKNTSATWLDDAKPVDVHLHGMVDYAKNVETVKDNLSSHRQRVSGDMGNAVPGAFAGGFPEIAYAASLHGQNLAEFQQYLNFLGFALMNVANAAQTIADCYSSTDGWSAASLDAVNFAYGDPSAKRPAGLPPGLGQTWSDAYYKAMAKQQEDAAKGGGDDSAHNWKLSSNYTGTDGSEHMTYTDQYGNTKTIVVLHQGNTTTTTVTTPKGTTTTVASTYTYPYGSVTTTTVTGPDGHPRTSTVNTSSVGNTSVVSNVDDKGHTTSSKTTTYNSDGSQTVTTRTYDDKGNVQNTDSVTYGQEAPGVGNSVDSPTKQAIDDTKFTHPSDDNTKTLAPGPLGGDPGTRSGSSGGVSV
jgi:hypothetical protein